MSTRFSHIIEFVADMDRAVAFYRDVIGLPLKFQSPEWSEFATGETTLALHPASAKNPAGKLDMGFTVPDLQQFHAEMQAKGVRFPMEPTKQDFGGMLAQFVDTEGAHGSVSGS
jgi:predicted enzyme related to lactoylglutathione lyase